MKLSLFNQWKSLKTHYRREFVYQTAKGTSAYVTTVKDVETGQILARLYTKDANSGVGAAQNLLNNTEPSDLQYALQHKELLQSQAKPADKQVDWRDGAMHSYKAQRKIVGEGKTYRNPKYKDFPEINNPVAKNANQFNKSATHRNKKTDYKRKPKHKGSDLDG